MDYRYQMFSSYLDELCTITGTPLHPETDKLNYYEEIGNSKYTRWVDVRAEQELIGFLIVGTAPNCHPDADYYIEEAYIKPDYRRKKHMFSALSEIVLNHRGVYCLFILDKNSAAKSFWEKSFTELGYLPCYLRDVGAGDEYCTQYGFKPNEYWC